MVHARAFKQVDVFSAVPCMGNPVAVVLDVEGLSDDEMQAMANWTNLSETTFVLPATVAGADYRVRIFTPRAELPFAGHPTLGTAHAVIEAGLAQPREGKLVQQCAIGLVEVSLERDGLSFRLPRFAMAPAPDPGEIAAAIGGIERLAGVPAIVDVGPRWVIAQLKSVEHLQGLEPNLEQIKAYDLRHGTTGLTVFAEGGAADLTVRSFAPRDGIPEDPVCGSGNAAVAAYRIETGTIDGNCIYLAAQGQEVGRDGKVRVRISDGEIHVGGSCTTCIDGVLRI